MQRPSVKSCAGGWFHLLGGCGGLWLATHKRLSIGAGACRQTLADVACPEGLEPPTYSLEGSCSIQLSYGQIG